VKPATKAAPKPTTKAAPKPATKAPPKTATKAAPKPAVHVAPTLNIALGTLAERPRANGHRPRAAKAAGLNGHHANGAAPVRVTAEAPRTAVRRAPVRGAAVPPAGPVTPAVPAGDVARTPDVWDERVSGALGFLRRRITGTYEVDEFGFDPELTEALVHPLLRLLYRRYFRVEASGVEHLPPVGSALLVANHSGTVPMDALMLTMGVHDETPLRRHLRLLGADLVFRLPVLSELARKSGSTLACNPDAERMLRNGEYVGVFPEGFKGIGKPYRDRYKLQRFGRGGFVSAAVRTGTPIIPVSIVGAEEIYPIIANVKPLAKLTGLPYVPVTPTFPWLGALGMLPLPSKWLIRFGEPIETASNTLDADDPIVVFNLADQVRETIQQTLHDLLALRPDPFG
jgi:1-acyl-sn-glycerol-3-phosphate acyltransferase